MIKVTVNEEKKGSDIKYPCLMECDGHIVWFHRRSEGTKLVKPNDSSGLAVGERSDCFDMGVYTAFKGSITLEND